jgi:hypothetical protein
VFFVSKDINARVKATALGIRAVDYEKQKINISKLYSGFGQIESSVDTMRSLEQDEEIPWHETLPPNFFFVMRHAGDGRTGKNCWPDSSPSGGFSNWLTIKCPRWRGFGRLIISSAWPSICFWIRMCSW